MSEHDQDDKEKKEEELSDLDPKNDPKGGGNITKPQPVPPILPPST